MTPAETEIRAVLDRRSKAILAQDLDGLTACYADDIVYFDLVPPLQYVGAAAVRARFAHWFEGWERLTGQELHDLHVEVGGDVAVASMLIRAGGVRQGEPAVEFWVRATSSFRRSGEGAWSITHEHVSLPVDMATGRAVLDLRPEA